jgi:transposase
MDRASLEQLLTQGLSLAEIGRRFGRHESTVAYWVAKYDLSAANRDRHAARGGIERELLEALVDSGKSIAEIASAVDRSKATIRHWLREYGLVTRRAGTRLITGEPPRRLIRECPHHGETDFQRRSSGGYRCLKCRSEAVTRRGRRVKQLLVEEAGGACLNCGYNRCVAALEFHHLLPTEKKFALSHRGVTRSIADARREAQKCVLLCANCHAEIEVGRLRLELSTVARVQSAQIPGSSGVA